MLEFKLFRRLKNEPYSEYKLVKEITVKELKKMYSIYEKYYANTQYAIFEQDFLEKTGVFLIKNPKNKQIVGFSTIIERDFIVDGKARHAFFSGDTIIEQEYWGSRALQRAMYRYIIRYKLRYPLQPVYWLLISKGFKTYLLLANNYYSYYPHYANKHEHLQKYVKAYCTQYYNEYFDERMELLDFGHAYQALNADVAPITENMRKENEKIAFFEACNPTWQKGTELPCIGELGWSDLSRYVLRFLTKNKSKGKATSSHLEENKPKLHIATDIKAA